jgi:hypothetical protein
MLLYTRYKLFQLSFMAIELALLCYLSFLILLIVIVISLFSTIISAFISKSTMAPIEINTIHLQFNQPSNHFA